MLWWTLRQLRSKSARKRLKAVSKLSDSRRSGVIPALTFALKDVVSDVQRAAAFALSKIGDARAISALIGALGEEFYPPHSQVFKGWQYEYRAMRSFQDHRERSRSEYRLYLEQSCNNVMDALAMIGTPAVQPLIEALEKNSFLVGESVTTALGRIGTPAVQPLIEALKDGDSGVRAYAAKALGKIGDKQAVQPLIEALKDETCYVQRNAAEALGKIGDKQAVQPLIEAFDLNLRDEKLSGLYDGTETLTFAFALVELDNVIAVMPLVKLMSYLAEHKVEHSTVRRVYEKLQGILGQIPELVYLDDLKRVLELDDVPAIDVYPRDPDTPRNDAFGQTETTVSCAALRRLAESELIRRGHFGRK